MKRELDIVILSDIHLGTYACHAKELLNYLKSIKVGTLILNGDFIDTWQFRKRYFPKEHLQVIQRILNMSTKDDTKVYYITGNHDDTLRQYTDFSSGNIHLRDKLELQLNGKSYWIFHGDIFDVFIKYASFLPKLGGKRYNGLILLNRLINKTRTAFGLPAKSFSKQIKNSVKKAVKFIANFENTAIRLAIKKGYDFVICGHIHKPQMRTVQNEEGKVTYLNAGDWVENLTALEYNWAHWSIYQYDESEYEEITSRSPVDLNNPSEHFEDDLEREINVEQILEQIMLPPNGVGRSER